MIRLQNLTHVFSRPGEDVTVLNDLTETIPTKGAFGILGAENSGKTTLMRLLAGFMTPQTGEISRHARLSFPIGYEGIFKRTLSPRENITRFSKSFGSQVDEITRYVLTNTELGTNFDVPLGRLPPTLQSRFVFVATFALPFDCYLIDERYTPNDPDFKRTCQRMMEERSEASGIVLATRRPNIVQRFCNAAGVLDKGKLVIYDRVDEAVEAFKQIQSNNCSDRTAAISPPLKQIGETSSGNSTAESEPYVVAKMMTA